MIGRIDYEPIDAYHADKTCISNSQLRLYARSPKLYYLQEESCEIERKITPAMKRGNLVHTAILEPDRLAVEYAVEPDWADVIRKDDGTQYANVKASKAYKEHHAEWLETHRDKIAIEAAELLEAQLMHEAVASCQLASELLEACDIRETSVRWQDMDTGVMCRCRPDARGVHTEFGPIAIDVKTAADPSPRAFTRKARYEFGYDQQAAYYTDGLASAGQPIERFFFIAVGATHPYEVYVYEAAPSFIFDGRSAYRKALRDLVTSREMDVWEHQYFNQIIPIQGMEL